MYFNIADDKLLEKYKKYIGLNILPIYDDRYTKTDMRTYVIKFMLIFVI